jgi:hypothetical protein
MEGLKNYRDKLNSIEKLVNKMESGELSIHELVDLEMLTRELHERSIILKYKAFEAAGSQREGFDNEVREEVIIPAIEEQVVVEETIEIPEAKLEDETPVLDFSLFDEPEEEVHEEVKAEIPPVQEVIESKPVVASIPEPKIDVKPDPIAEEPIVVVREKGSSFLDRLKILDNSISSQLAGRKIDTLTGAFGINERLLYINELFDGSGEAFSNAIKTLDSQDNLDAASHKVEELAFQNSWNPEEEVVLEFLAIIKRRYA